MIILGACWRRKFLMESCILEVTTIKSIPATFDHKHEFRNLFNASLSKHGTPTKNRYWLSAFKEYDSRFAIPFGHFVGIQ